jgi:hypothetical protein
MIGGIAADEVLIEGDLVVAAGAAGHFECGSRPAGEFLLQNPSLGFALRASLRLSKLAPGEFVFACPKTNLSGTNLDARSAPEGFAPGSAQIQRNQKKGHPNDTLNPARFALHRGRPKGLPVPRAPLRAVPVQDCNARACHTGPITKIVSRDKAQPFPAGLQVRL